MMMHLLYYSRSIFCFFLLKLSAVFGPGCFTCLDPAVTTGGGRWCILHRHKSKGEIPDFLLCVLLSYSAAEQGVDCWLWVAIIWEGSGGWAYASCLFNVLASHYVNLRYRWHTVHGVSKTTANTWMMRLRYVLCKYLAPVLITWPLWGRRGSSS